MRIDKHSGRVAENSENQKPSLTLSKKFCFFYGGDRSGRERESRGEQSERRLGIYGYDFLFLKKMTKHSELFLSILQNSDIDHKVH
jgi:hypothetical protein